MKCRICGNECNNEIIVANEMRVNDGNHFDYFKCGKCGCVQIVVCADNLAKYYNENYYSYNNNQYNAIKRKLIKVRNESFYKGTLGWAGRLLNQLFPIKFDFKMRLDVLKRYTKNFDDPIIDVGCGAGHFVDMINDCGFANVSGCDPFIEKDFITCQGNNIYKRNIFELSDKYQAITMIHSFEHMDNPIEVCIKAKELLADNGSIVIEIPVIGYAWQRYGTDWVLFDSPVHLFLHTVESIREICKRTNMKLVDVIYKGTDYQFRGSDLIQKGICIDKQETGDFKRYPEKRKYWQWAELLNEMELADMAIFVIQS